MEKIVELSFNDAVEAIDNTATVMYKHGVWNKYERVTTEYAQQKIMNSGYGADVYEESGTYYVSIPCDSDMW